jgi:hypothetical protein
MMFAISKTTKQNCAKVQPKFLFQAPESVALEVAPVAPPAGAAGALPRHGVAGGGVQARAAVLTPRTPRPRRTGCTRKKRVT